jgi:hypothetical protein
MKQATRHRRQFVKQTFCGPGCSTQPVATTEVWVSGGKSTNSRAPWSGIERSWPRPVESHKPIIKDVDLVWIKKGKTWQDSDLVESVEIVKGAGRSLSCSRVQEGQAILVDMEREREGCGNRTLSIEFWWEVYFADHASGLLGLANCKNCVPSSLGAEYANIFWTDSKPSSQSSRFTTWRCCQRITMIIM